MERTRIDKWVWAARFFKTRSAATEAVAAGHVRIDGERAKPSTEVRAGATVEIAAHGTRWVVVVRAVADKRGSATVARTLYEETPESAERRAQAALERRLALPPGADLGVRPTKRDRRRLEALRRAQRGRGSAG